MRYFIIKGDGENKIMKVQDEDVPAFKKEYCQQIVLEGSNVQDLMIQLSDKLNSDNETLTQLVR